jgi:DNA ligase-1
MKPLLAGEITDPTKLRFPVYVSPKYDGIRALVVDGKLVSRTFKPIPNHFIRDALSLPEYNGLDGELIIGPTFQDTTSGVMRESGEPRATYFVFDDTTEPAWAFKDRYAYLQARMKLMRQSNMVPFTLVGQQLCATWAEVENYHLIMTDTGFEGTMVRSVTGPYKFGRSTEKEQILLKLKNFKDDEAEIVGFEELMTNLNPATKDAFGRTKRGKRKEFLVPANTLGALIVNHRVFGVFSIGTGFDDKLRAEIWANRPDYLGKLVKFRYQPDGTKNKPRIPSFQGIRHPDDL